MNCTMIKHWQKCSFQVMHVDFFPFGEMCSFILIHSHAWNDNADTAIFGFNVESLLAKLPLEISSTKTDMKHELHPIQKVGEFDGLHALV